MKFFTRSAIVGLSAFLGACVTPSMASGPANPDGHHAAGKHNETRPYDALSNARADIDAAMAAAKADNKMTIVAMGANWCHDSRGLAAQFEKDRFQTLLSRHYHVVYVDVGQKNRNINIAQGFGVEKIVGTPTVFVLASSGGVLNLETAPTWRNAASRSEDEVFAYFEAFTQSAPAKSRP